MGGKLDIRWTGPYEVVEDLGKQRYRVKSKKTGKLLKNTVHCCRLKHYIQPATDIDEPDEEENVEEVEIDGKEQDHECVQGSNKEEMEVKQVCILVYITCMIFSSYLFGLALWG